ncbi:hypothetical protein [Mesonia aquimarina]|nr:hypothetical protein [Mesonia aquimarina]
MSIQKELRNKWLPVLKQDEISEEDQKAYEKDLEKYQKTTTTQA